MEDSYLKCIVTRNDIIQDVLKLKVVDNKYKKAIHLASVALSQIYVGKIEEGNKYLRGIIQEDKKTAKPTSE